MSSSSAPHHHRSQTSVLGIVEPFGIAEMSGAPLRARRGIIRVPLVLTVCALIGLSAGCGKTITIGGPAASAPESAPASSAPASPAPPAPPASSEPPAQTPSGQGSSASAGQSSQGNTVQVVDGSAAKNGQNGDGGTVTGTEEQQQPPRWVQLSAVESSGLDAAHLINVNQAALYRFDKDDSNPSKSACYDDCAKKWPPVTINEKGNIYLAGVDKSQIGAIRRDTGEIQLTVGGWPIYRFAMDSQPGDLKGQGVGGTWFAVGADGHKVTSG